MVYWIRSVFPCYSSDETIDGSVVQIQPDMIALDPEFIGSMAPPSKLTGGDVTNIPFARLPRLERLKLGGKADETEDVEIAQYEEEDEEVADGKSNAQESRAKKEKMKMRGKSKSLKRFVACTSSQSRFDKYVQVFEEEEEECDRSQLCAYFFLLLFLSVTHSLSGRIRLPCASI